jgi:hypothetical protein
VVSNSGYRKVASIRNPHSAPVLAQTFLKIGAIFLKTVKRAVFEICISENFIFKCAGLFEVSGDSQGVIANLL